MAKLGEICRITSAKRIFESEYVTDGVPFIRGLEITNGSIGKSDIKYECYISKERYQALKLSSGVPLRGDILITSVGTIGNLCYVDFEQPFYYKDGNIIQLTDFQENVHSKYLYYFMKSPYFIKQLNNALIGAVQKALTIVMLKDIEIILPDFATQENIANKLSIIDKKIANNNAICSDLESLAELLYDYWFIQFDFPDENGRPYKSSGGKMVWNEKLKRNIPVGWEVKPLGDYISIIRGVSFKPEDELKQRSDNSISLLKSNNIQNGMINFDKTVFLPSYLAERNQWLTKGSVFITMSSGSKAHMGKTAVIYEDLPYVFGAFCAKIVIDDSIMGYLATYFRGTWFRAYIENVTAGTSINNIGNEQLSSILLPIPDSDTQNRFEEQLKPMFARQGELENETRQLSSLRDFLLPMLMNGQVNGSK